MRHVRPLNRKLNMLRATGCLIVAVLGMTMPRASANQVTVDSSGVTRIDGTVFTPIGVYALDLTDTDLQIIKDGGFNTVLSYTYGRSGGIAAATNFLDRANAKGLKVIFSLKDFYDGDPEFPAQYGKSGDQLTIDFVTALKDKPALLAWYSNDEKPTSSIPQLEARRNLIRTLDTNHPVYGVGNVAGDVALYKNSTDVFGMDAYPIGITANGVSGNVGSAYDKFKDAADRFSAAPYKPMWQVTQAFNWNVDGTGGGAYDGTEPSYKQKKTMAIMALIAKAKGIVLYSYFTNVLGFNGSFTGAQASSALASQRLSEMQAIGQELDGLKTVIATGTEVAPVGASIPGVLARMVQTPTTTYLLLSNRDNYSKQITYEVPAWGWNSGVSQANGSKQWEIAGGKWLVGELDAEESVALRLSGAAYSSPNPVANQSFEANLGQSPTSWATWAGSSGTNADADYVETGYAAFGAQNLTHYKPVAYEVTTYQTITGLANGRYCLRGWFRSSGGQNNCSFAVLNYGGTKQAKSVSSTTPWTPLVIDNIVVTNGQATVELYSNAPGQKWVMADNIMLTKQNY